MLQLNSGQLVRINADASHRIPLQQDKGDEPISGDTSRNGFIYHDGSIFGDISQTEPVDNGKKDQNVASTDGGMEKLGTRKGIKVVRK